MTDHVCLEWALADQFGTTDIVTASNNDRIVFPHVDSCVGVVFLMAGGGAIGGHVSIMTKSGIFDYNDSLEEMLARMWSMVNGPTISGILYVGHPSWGNSIKPCQGEFAALRTVRANNLCKSTFNDALDVFVDLGAGRIRVQKWKEEKGRLANAVPAETGTTLYDRPYSEGMSHYG